MSVDSYCNEKIRFSMMSTNKYRLLLYLVSPLMLLSLTISAPASVLEKGKKVHISSLHHIDHDLYAFGQKVIVDGTVNGDCIAGAAHIFINGTIVNSGFFASQSLNITGNVNGSVRVFAKETVIDGTIGRSLVGMGESISLGRSSTIGRDIQLMGKLIRVSGIVEGKSSRIEGESINIAGHFNGDLEIQGRDITIGPSAIIDGDLTYFTSRKDMIDIADGAIITGETKWQEVEHEAKEEDGNLLSATTIAISKGFASLIFGIIILLLFRPYIIESCIQLQSRFALSCATGILFSIIWIFSLLLFLFIGMFVIIGSIAISGDNPSTGIIILLLAGPMLPISGFVSMAGGITFYTGIVVVGFSLGGLITSRAKRDISKISVRELIVGLLLITPLLVLSFIIPTIVSLLYILIMLAGAGAIILGIRQCRRGFSHIQTEQETIAVSPKEKNDIPESNRDDQ